MRGRSLRRLLGIRRNSMRHSSRGTEGSEGAMTGSGATASSTWLVGLHDSNRRFSFFQKLRRIRLFGRKSGLFFVRGQRIRRFVKHRFLLVGHQLHFASLPASRQRRCFAAPDCTLGEYKPADCGKLVNSANAPREAQPLRQQPAKDAAAPHRAASGQRPER